MFAALDREAAAPSGPHRRGGRRGHGRDHGGPRAAGADRRLARRAGDERRAAGRRSSGSRGRCARARRSCRGSSPTCSTPAAPAAIARTRSTSRRSRRSWSPPAASGSRSTATGRCRAGAAAPISSKRSASTSRRAPAVVERCLDEAGIAFFFAPTFHPSMRHAGPTRKDLGVRTAFNLLGPLTNPAGAARQLVGVPRPELTELVARSLGAPRIGARLGRARRRRPRRDFDDRLHEGVGVPRRRRQHVLRASRRRRPRRRPRRRRCAAATRRTTPRIAREVLAGARGAARDIVLLNAGASLLIAGAARGRDGRHPSGGRRRSTPARAAATLERLDRVVERGAGGGMTNGTGSALVSDLLETIVAATQVHDGGTIARGLAIDRLERQVTRQPKGQAFRERAARPRRRRESSPSASAGRRRRASCARTTTRRRTRPPMPAPERRRSRCSPSRRSSTGASSTLRRSAPRSTCRFCARTSSSPSTSCSRRSAFGADAVLLIVGALDDRRACARCWRPPRRSGWPRSSKCTIVAELARARRARARTSSASTAATCGRLTVDPAVSRAAGAAHAGERDRRRGERHSHARRHRSACRPGLSRVPGRRAAIAAARSGRGAAGAASVAREMAHDDDDAREDLRHPAAGGRAARGGARGERARVRVLAGEPAVHRSVRRAADRRRAAAVCDDGRCVRRSAGARRVRRGAPAQPGRDPAARTGTRGAVHARARIA